MTAPLVVASNTFPPTVAGVKYFAFANGTANCVRSLTKDKPVVSGSATSGNLAFAPFVSAVNLTPLSTSAVVGSSPQTMPGPSGPTYCARSIIPCDKSRAAPPNVRHVSLAMLLDSSSVGSAGIASLYGSALTNTAPA